MISQEEFYMEVKKKWKSLYPAYFDKTKTIAQGTTTPTQVEKSQDLWQSTVPLCKKSSWL